MQKLQYMVGVLSLLGSMASGAEIRTTEQVVKHHIEALKLGDANMLMEDYADNAVAVIRPGIFAGKRDLRRMCEILAAVPDIGTFESTVELISGDVMLEHWTIYRGRSDERSGTDVVVVRNGKIVFQTTEPSTH
jgi:ketosteroid isomerase-like protein